MSKQRVIRCFLASDMRNGHLGLASLAKEAGVNVDKLEPGEYVAFVNSARDRLKVYAHNNVVAYFYKKGTAIDLRAIAGIPQAFGGSGKMDYDAALKKTLERELKIAQ